MTYTKDELGFILYNNRSVNGVVNNFLPKDINPFHLIQIENLLDISKSKFKTDEKIVTINIKEINTNAPDIIVNPNDIKKLTKIIKRNIGKFSEIESEFLLNRGSTESIIKEYSLLGLSNIKNKKHLQYLGATCHPTLSKFIDDGIEHGGIIIPLFKDDKLVNCAIRKINSNKSLKYSLACPDVPVWNIETVNKNDEIWICEGIFDMMAINSTGQKAISCSSAMWSGLQLYQVIEKKPSKINIFSDNDEVGVRTSAILKDFFISYGIKCVIFVSELGKDPWEHFFQKNGKLSDLKIIEPIVENHINKDKSPFNFINHLKNRKF